MTAVASILFIASTLNLAVAICYALNGYRERRAARILVGQAQAERTFAEARHMHAMKCLERAKRTMRLATERYTPSA